MGFYPHIFVRFASKQRQLLRVFSGRSSALIRKVDYITVLAVRKIEDLDVAHLGKITLNPVDPRLERLLPIDKSSVNRELAALKPLIKQKVAEVRGGPALRLGVGGQIKHHEYPHDPIA